MATKESDICSICHEDLSTNLYTLPECSHTFHCNCIMHWFRAKHNTCPLCNNTGVNSQYDIPWTLRQGAIENYKRLRTQSRRKNAPEELKKQIANLKKFEDKLKINQKEYLKWKNTIQGVNGETWGELKKINRKYRNKKWQLERKIKTKKISIGISSSAVPTPIIIATKINV